MIFVIGGLGGGKRGYVKTLGFTDAEMADAVIDDKPVVYNLQNLVTARQGAYMDLLPVLLEKKVVICNEVGSGIVPVDRAERFAREATGRLCVELASQAEKVVRVCCGIPAVIKG